MEVPLYEKNTSYFESYYIKDANRNGLKNGKGKLFKNNNTPK